MPSQIDHEVYPHIVDLIISYADFETQCVLRETCRLCRARMEEAMCKQLCVKYPTLNNPFRDLKTQLVVPCMAWPGDPDAPGAEAAKKRTLRLLKHVRVLGLTKFDGDNEFRKVTANSVRFTTLDVAIRYRAYRTSAEVTQAPHTITHTDITDFHELSCQHPVTLRGSRPAVTHTVTVSYNPSALCIGGAMRSLICPRQVRDTILLFKECPTLCNWEDGDVFSHLSVMAQAVYRLVEEGAAVTVVDNGVRLYNGTWAETFLLEFESRYGVEQRERLTVLTLSEYRLRVGEERFELEWSTNL